MNYKNWSIKKDVYEIEMLVIIIALAFYFVFMSDNYYWVLQLSYGDVYGFVT